MDPQVQMMQQMMQQLATMSVEERAEWLSAQPEPLRRQIEAAQRGMEDLYHLAAQLKPSADSPDKYVDDFQVIKAVATCPSMHKIDEITPGDQKIGDSLDALELAMHNDGVLDDAAVEILQTISRPHRRNVLLLFWQMYERKLEEKVTLDELSKVQHRIVNQFAQQTLAKAQVMMVQQRWVQVCFSHMILASGSSYPLIH